MKCQNNLLSLICLVLCLYTGGTSADELKIAVASNFYPTLKKISTRFEQASEHRIKLLSGSTGKHYAQIINGAPYDAFFAADKKRPLLLENRGLTVKGSRFSYAFGQLVLWSPEPGLVDPGAHVLNSNRYKRLAIANPRLAPYGLAAQQVLQRQGLWTALQSRLVRGENIAQTYQFISSANAELGFIARSQWQKSAQNTPGSYWLVPTNWHQAIEQQAVMLTDTAALRSFFSYLLQPSVLALIQSDGYLTSP